MDSSYRWVLTSYSQLAQLFVCSSDWQPPPPPSVYYSQSVRHIPLPSVYSRVNLSGKPFPLLSTRLYLSEILPSSVCLLDFICPVSFPHMCTQLNLSSRLGYRPPHPLIPQSISQSNLLFQKSHFIPNSSNLLRLSDTPLIPSPGPNLLYL